LYGAKTGLKRDGSIEGKFAIEQYVLYDDRTSFPYRPSTGRSAARTNEAETAEELII